VEASAVPVLPLIDLLIMVGWTSMMAAGLLKAIRLTTAYRPELLGLGPAELLVFAGACLLFGLALAARTWVKYNEPKLMAQRRSARAEGERSLHSAEGANVAALPAAQRAAADGS
jgi:glucose-6-phosphate-specific signal transduction histidine kinase